MRGSDPQARARVAMIAALLFATAPAHAAGALETLAPDVAKQLGALPAGVVVVASPLSSDQPVTKGEELASRVAQLVAASLGGTARANAQPATLGAARAIAQKASALVYVQLELAKGELRATADVYPVMSNGWDRIRVPQPAPRAHAFGVVT